MEKPAEIFHIIEHFCLGRRRLHVFGNDSTLRPGMILVLIKYCPPVRDLVLETENLYERSVIMYYQMLSFEIQAHMFTSLESVTER